MVILATTSFAFGGIYDAYLELLELGKTNYTKKIAQLRNNPSNLLDIKDIDSVDLDPDYIGHVFTYTPARYAYLGTKDECSLYDLLLAGVVKDFNGLVDYVIVRYLTKDGKKKRSYVKLDVFMNTVAIPKCPKIKTFQAYFDIKNFSSTVKAINLTPPVTIGDCRNVHREFILDHKTPYLCAINDEIQNIDEYDRQMKNTPKTNPRLRSHYENKFKNADAYRKKINKHGLSYLENLCENIEDVQNFCDNFFNKNFWSRVLDNERSEWSMMGLCQGILQRDKLNKQNYQVCGRKIALDTNICRLSGLHYPVLQPKPSCENLEKALNYSRLRAPYQDCPGQTGSLAIVNIARILQHFFPEEDKEKSYCSLTSASTFLSFNQESVEARTWDIHLCYEDKINEKEVCLPTLNGNYGDSEFNIGKVVSYIMSKTRATDPDMVCEVVSDKDYNPALLKFKNGCFVVLNSANCSAIDCEIKIIHKERKVTHITHKQNVHVDYIANNTKFEKFSQMSLLKEYKNIREKKIINMTILQNFLKDHPNGIIHAIGCIEDLYPGQFLVRAFNQCSPTPLIIDGYIEKKGYFSLVTRTALDDIQSPRLVPWNYLYKAIKSYQKIHPLKIWSLNGLYIK